MKRIILKEEEILRNRIRGALWKGIAWTWSTYDQDIRALVKAVEWETQQNPESWLPSTSDISNIIYSAGKEYDKNNEQEILGGYEIEEYIAEKIREHIAAAIRGREKACSVPMNAYDVELSIARAINKTARAKK